MSGRRWIDGNVLFGIQTMADESDLLIVSRVSWPVADFYQLRSNQLRAVMVMQHPSLMPVIFYIHFQG